MAERRLSVASIRRFFKEVKVEMQKVTWPSKDEVIGSAIVVIVTTIILTIYVGIADFGFSKLVHWILIWASGAAG